MANDAMERERRGMTNSLTKRLHQPKNVFAPGHRIRMNIVPMFLMIFIPWGIFIFILGTQSFTLMYLRPFTAYMLLAFAILFWVACVLVAMNRRKWDPEPAWYSFFALMVGIAVLFGAYLGHYLYTTYSFPYYQVRDLKVIKGLDAGKEKGQNVMDAGMFYFAEGNKLDARRAWHFKQKTLYCVAPVIMGDYPSVPQSQSFDFWAVGKDCCSVASSDFRCGDYNNPLARGGIRNMIDDDRAFYRLAVEQATSLYGIQSKNPIFFEWALDPAATVTGWNRLGFNRFMAYCAFFLVFFIFAMAMATCAFSFIGRAESVYGEEIFDDPDWKKGGPKTEMDLRTHEQKVPGLSQRV